MVNFVLALQEGQYICFGCPSPLRLEFFRMMLRTVPQQEHLYVSEHSILGIVFMPTPTLRHPRRLRAHLPQSLPWAA